MFLFCILQKYDRNKHCLLFTGVNVAANSGIRTVAMLLLLLLGNRRRPLVVQPVNRDVDRNDTNYG